MTLPHNPEADVRDVSSLPTPEMYSFQALEKLGGQKLFNLIERAVGKELLPPPIQRLGPSQLSHEKRKLQAGQSLRRGHQSGGSSGSGPAQSAASPQRTPIDAVSGSVCRPPRWTPGHASLSRT